MSITAQDLIENRQPPVTVRPDDNVSKALELMIENDYSQLAVVDNEQHPKGLITADSILRALSNFDVTLEKLNVRDALETRRAYSSELSIFDLLENLESNPAVLITDANDILIGIITDWDTADYFRRRAEDLMLIEDIEARLKEHILAAFTNSQTGESEQSELQNAIDEVSNAQTFTAAKTAVIKYIAHSGNAAVKFEQAIFDEVCKQHLATNDKKLEDATLNQLTDLFLHKSRWNTYGKNFTVDETSLRGLLKKVRIARNKLAHFRDELTPSQRETLRFSRDWFERNQPIKPKIEVLSPIRTMPETIVEESPVYEEVGTTNSRYARLADYLQNLRVEREELAFEKIEEIIGETLPSSARQHRSWWANDAVSHIQSKQWLEVGWRVSNINLTDGIITFARNKEREAAYINFFTSLTTYLKSQADFPIKEMSPKGINWHPIGSVRTSEGQRVAIFVFSFARGGYFRIELYIDTGNAEMNKEIFDLLYNKSITIEVGMATFISSDFTRDKRLSLKRDLFTVAWERLDNRRASRIALYTFSPINGTADNLQNLIKWATYAMIDFRRIIMLVLSLNGYIYTA